MKRGLARYGPIFLAILLLTACGGGSAVSAGGGAEIPEEILGELDEETLEGLVEGPKYVALTFDDGPRRDTTSVLLDGLLERGVSATFFVIGRQIPGNEDLLRRMRAEGHQVGNHTWSHVRLSGRTAEETLEEVGRTEAALEEILGPGSYWLRPPYGLVDQQAEAAVDVPMVKWSVDPRDWESRNTEQVVRAILSAVEPNSIILLHDLYPTSVEAALQVVDALQAEGYVFVTVEELLERNGVTPEPGVLYCRGTG